MLLNFTENEISDDNSTKCDDLVNRLDNLNNISPNFYLFDDDEFPRITENSIDGSNTTGNLIRIIFHFSYFPMFYKNLRNA